MPGDFWIPLSFKAFNSGPLWGEQEDKWDGLGTSALIKCSSLFSEAQDSSLRVSDFCLQFRLQDWAISIPAQAQAGATGGQGRLGESRPGTGQSFVPRPDWSWASSIYVSSVVRIHLDFFSPQHSTWRTPCYWHIQETVTAEIMWQEAQAGRQIHYFQNTLG